MSMFQAARSASLIGWPKRGLSGKGCTACGPVLPSGMPLKDWFAHPEIHSAATARARLDLSLADRIAHLAFGVDRPGLNAVVVLHEARDRARLLDFLHCRLHVARAVERAAHQHGRGAIPVPADLDARQAFVPDRLLDHRLAPVPAAVDRHVHRADPARAGPRQPGDLVVAGVFELLSARGRGDDGLAFHHHAELPPLAFRHRIGIARGLAAQVPGLVGDLDAPQPLDAGVAFPAWKHEPDWIAVFRPQALAVHRVSDDGVVKHFLYRDRARMRRCVGAFEQRPPAARIDARLLEQRGGRYAGPQHARDKAVLWTGVPAAT